MSHKMTQSEVEEFTEAYRDVISISTEHGDVHERMSSAAEHDGIEARFAEEGTEALFRFAVKMRNEWAEMIVDIREQAEEMEAVVGGIIVEDLPPIVGDLLPLVEKQIETMRDLADSLESGLKCKDKLMNSRLESREIQPGMLTEVESFDPQISTSPATDYSDLKEEQDIYMTMVSKDVGKIGDYAGKRSDIIQDAEVVP